MWLLSWMVSVCLAFYVTAEWLYRFTVPQTMHKRCSCPASLPPLGTVIIFYFSCLNGSVVISSPASSLLVCGWYYHTVLISVAIKYILKFDRGIPPTVVISENCFSSSSSLAFSYKFWNDLVIFTKNCWEYDRS